MTQKWKVAGATGLAAIIVVGVMLWLQARSGGPDPARWPGAGPVTVIIPNTPGGGHDTYVRRFAPVLEEFLGTPVLPENMPGAGGRLGAGAIYRAKPDGYTVGILNIPGLAIAEILGESVPYEIDRITWLAQLSSEPYAIVVGKDAGIESFADLCRLGRPVNLSVDAIGTTATITSIIAMALAECPYQLVSGYHDTTQATLAVMRGDVDARISPVGSLLPYHESGDVRMLMTFEETASVPGIPAAGELGYTELTRFVLHRVIGGPPGMPPAIRERFSQAWLEAAESTAIQTWSRESKRPIVALDQAETTIAVGKSVSYYRQYVGLIRREVQRFSD